MDQATRQLLNSLAILVLGAGLTFVATRYWNQKNQVLKEAEKLADAAVKEAGRLRDLALAEAAKIADGHAKLAARVQELELQLSGVKQSVVPITAAFQAILIKELTHYHTPTLDALMQKIGPPNTLTEDEEKEMARLLEERSNDLEGGISESERDAATMLPLVVKRARAEAALPAEATELQMVSAPKSDATETTGTAGTRDPVAEKKSEEGQRS